MTQNLLGGIDGRKTRTLRGLLSRPEIEHRMRNEGERRRPKNITSFGGGKLLSRFEQQAFFFLAVCPLWRFK
jgi:hypothetical protein